jgi:multiple sugar transport system substrate-binding protein/raffinose/stachyose/melibiose transport system substrate-binding protein
MSTTHLTLRPRRRGRLITALGALAGLAVLSACSTPGSDGGAVNADEPTAASTDLGTEPVTITLYDGAGLKAIDDALIAAFTEKHPHVTVETRFDPDNVQAQNAPRVLASDNPPDLARIVALGDIVGNDLLTPLTPWAEAYGWDVPEGQMAMYTVDDEGVRGSGTQYTVASGFVTTGVFYNKQLAEQIGMTEPPTTVEEFADVLATAKAAGITPIIAGNATGQGVTITQMLINDHMGAEAVNDWVFNAPDATIDTPESVEAVQSVADWVEAGYFNDDANGTDNAAAAGRFAQGEALFYPSGNWDAAALGAAMGDDVGFFAPPALEEGSILAMSDPVTNFGIPARAENKDAAAAFLDFLMSEEARAVLVDHGFAPSGSGETPSTEPGSLNEAVQTSFAQLVEADGQVQFVQNATNGSTAAWNEQSQLLFAGRATPADYVAAIQANYEEELRR